jgi:molybdopterin-guanine dinucleotide biosynthesis protein A
VTIEAFLLAGGSSTRMGRDKALLDFRGGTFLDAVAAAAAPLAGRVTVVGRAGGEVGGYPAVADLRPGLGPLAGIETALTYARSEAAIVLACDTPLVSTDLLALLAERAAAGGGPRIAVPLDADGRLAPLCGVYPVRALPEVTALLDAGERRPRALVERFASVVVPFEEYGHLDRAADLLRNVNRPEEYERLDTKA